MIEKYISEIGEKTGELLKEIIHKLVVIHYKSILSEKELHSLSNIIILHIFGESFRNDEQKMLFDQNNTLIEVLFSNFAKNETICEAFTNAMYNYCYGKYVDSGRKIGLFICPYLGYIRALNDSMKHKEDSSFPKRYAIVRKFQNNVGFLNVFPFTILCQNNLYRILPNLPDSKKCYESVLLYSKRLDEIM